MSELVSSIKAFQDAVARFDAAVAAKLRLNDTDLRCLTMLRDRGPSQPSQLAAAVGLSRSATTTVLGRLEAQGYVRRQPNEHDGRSYLVTLSPNVDVEMAKLWRPIYENGRINLELYTDEDLCLLTTFMEQAKTLHDNCTRDIIDSASLQAD